MKKIKVLSVKWHRTDEERQRRHLYGDKGAKFAAKRMVLGSGVMSCITTLPDKYNLICIMHEED